MLPIQKQEEHSPDMIPLNDKVVSNPESVAYILTVPIAGTKYGPSPTPSRQSEIAVDVGVIISTSCKNGTGSIKIKAIISKICPIMIKYFPRVLCSTM